MNTITGYYEAANAGRQEKVMKALKITADTIKLFYMAIRYRKERIEESNFTYYHDYTPFR